ncbi:MAG: RNA polymerase sigma factor RpoD/SigA [Acidobacteriota bacterium]|nr:RNA polymerase sigma factor RpoD/SigA [Acidobacteriota bacterium]
MDEASTVDPRSAAPCSAPALGGGDRPSPSTAGEQRLAERKAISKWIKSALAYVPAVARRFVGCGLSFDDLLAAGNLGLVEAALRFDPARNVKFVTYADWWIRKTILKAIQEQTGPVRLPRYRLEQLRELHDTRARLTESRGREPEVQELAEATGRSIAEVSSLMTMGRRGVSIEQPVSGAENRPLGSTLADDPDKGPQSTLIRQDVIEHLRRLVDGLENRERRVLTLRFGLAMNTPMTLREVGREIGISRERVRQIERRALGHLRSLL